MSRYATFRNRSQYGYGITFVLFFLAVELGQSRAFDGFEALLMAITLLAVLVLPYFLADEPDRSIASFVGGRSVIAVLGVVSGIAFRQSIGTLLPESISYLPMTMLIVSAAISSYFQIYGILGLRLVK